MSEKPTKQSRIPVLHMDMCQNTISVLTKSVSYIVLSNLPNDGWKVLKSKTICTRLSRLTSGVNITMPVASILRDEDDHNYAKAKAAFTSLSKKGAEYEDDKIWFYTAIIEHPKIEKGTGIATFHVYDPIWRAALDFTKGFKKYELITAMKFKSVYAMRFYELMSGQTKPLFVPLVGSDGLRERFCLQGKYERE
ncbi:replication initiation protein [Bacteroides fragilis]|nr:replication initiation protein [Bacteroides fragilis]